MTRIASTFLSIASDTTTIASTLFVIASKKAREAVTPCHASWILIDFKAVYFVWGKEIDSGAAITLFFALSMEEFAVELSLPLPLYRGR